MRRAFYVFAMVLLLVTSPPVAAEEGVIGPGDTIRIAVLGEEQLTRQVIVDPGGNIALPLAGELKVGGLTPGQAAEMLRTELAKYVKRPDVTVDIVATGRKNVVVAGAVRNPGAYEVDANARLMDAVALAGGSLPLANLAKVTVTRGQDKTTTTYDLATYAETADDAQNPPLQAGDIVTVPEMVPVRGEIFVTGEVVERGPMPLREGMTVRDAIGAAGGLTENADPTNATIKRAGNPASVPLDVAVAMEGDPRADLQLNSGDWIFIPSVQQLGTFSVFGEVNRPGTYPIRGKVLLTDAVAQAGGLTQRAKTSDVRYTKSDAAPVRVDIAKVIDGASENPELKPGDSIFVGRRREPIDPFRAAGVAISLLWAILRATD